MQKGDLSNASVPRLVVVFEGAVGILLKDKEKRFSRLSLRGRWLEAINLYELNESMMKTLLDVTWRLNYNVNLITWLGQEAAEAIEERMDEEGIPIRGCLSSNPQKFARELSYHPDIVRIYDPDPAHQFVFGSKGEVLLSPLQIGRF